MKKILRLDLQLWMGVAVLAALVVNVGLAFSLSRAGDAEASDPFTDLEVTLISTPECAHCFDLQSLREYLVQNGVQDEQIKTVAYDSREGKKLIKKHEIKKVPTAVIPGSAMELDFMAGIAENLGSINNGALVISEVQMPYLDLDLGKVVGEFELIVLDDQTCTECYDAQLHEDVLARLFMTPAKNTTIDIGSQEGKDMLESYAISSIPTILMRGDLESYTNLQEIWPSVGSIEDDGTYILRQGVANMGAYKQLPGGEIIDTTSAAPDEAAA